MFLFVREVFETGFELQSVKESPAVAPVCDVSSRADARVTR